MENNAIQRFSQWLEDVPPLDENNDRSIIRRSADLRQQAIYIAPEGDLLICVSIPHFLEEITRGPTCQNVS